MLYHVLLIDDDEAFLSAMCSVLGSDVSVSTARSVAETRAVRAIPDIAFVDLALPDGDGVDLVEELSRSWPEVPLVVLTVNRAQERVLAAFRAGARGYVYKEDVARRLPRIIEEAREGGAPMSPEVARRVLGLVAQLPPARAVEEPLTPRELEVVSQFAAGATYEQAAAALGTSINTVRSQVREVYRKLSVGTRTEAVLAALQLGLLDRRCTQNPSAAAR
ncbi:MAG TPA: response regulator transcription factor [Labilithrix sp.]|nr:response regulator transcription factor [Labilithrix sp.]